MFSWDHQIIQSINMRISIKYFKLKLNKFVSTILVSAILQFSLCQNQLSCVISEHFITNFTQISVMKNVNWLMPERERFQDLSGVVWCDHNQCNQPQLSQYQQHLLQKKQNRCNSNHNCCYPTKHICRNSNHKYHKFFKKQFWPR